MGMTLWIHTLEGRTMSKQSADHSAMYRLTDQLDAIADSLGVSRLSDFFDDTELRQEALRMGDESDSSEGDDDVEDEPLDPETGWAYGIDDMKWFDVEKGLATLEALRKHVASPESRIRGASAKPLLEELEDCISVLRSASVTEARFNLAVVP